MVYAWLLSSPPSFRVTDDTLQPFQAKAVRRRVDLRVRDDSLRQIFEDLEISMPWEVGAASHIVALLELQPAFQYSHLRVLDFGERMQYYHWKAIRIMYDTFQPNGSLRNTGIIN